MAAMKKKFLRLRSTAALPEPDDAVEATCEETADDDEPTSAPIKQRPASSVSTAMSLDMKIKKFKEFCLKASDTEKGKYLKDHFQPGEMSALWGRLSTLRKSATPAVQGEWDRISELKARDGKVLKNNDANHQPRVVANTRAGYTMHNAQSDHNSLSFVHHILSKRFVVQLITLVVFASLFFR